MIPKTAVISLTGEYGLNQRIGGSNLTSSFIFSGGSDENIRTTPTPNPASTDKHTISFDITGDNASVSVLKNSIKSAEFFPKVGSSQYTDKEGTTYLIRSSNTNLYRIDEITLISSTYTKAVYRANDDESLKLKLKLTNDTSISIQVKEVPQVKPENPLISIDNTGAREYNINSESGVPLLLNKNEDVKAITVVVGEDIMEFDDLDEGDSCGITIPKNMFENIGKYNIKIFPFSFEDYDNMVETTRPAIKIKDKNVSKPIREIEEEEVEKDDNFNPYSPPQRPTPNDRVERRNDRNNNYRNGRPTGRDNRNTGGGLGFGSILDRNPYN